MRYKSSHFCLCKCMWILNSAQSTLNSSLLLLLYYFIAVVHTLTPKSSHVPFLRSKSHYSGIRHACPICSSRQILVQGLPSFHCPYKYFYLNNPQILLPGWALVSPCDFSCINIIAENVYTLLYYEAFFCVP